MRLLRNTSHLLLSFSQKIHLAHHDNYNMQPPIQIRTRAHQLLNASIQRHNRTVQHSLRQQRTSPTRKQGWEDLVQRRADSLWLSYHYLISPSTFPYQQFRRKNKTHDSTSSRAPNSAQSAHSPAPYLLRAPYCSRGAHAANTI
jgi:hypothetical protein